MGTCAGIVRLRAAISALCVFWPATAVAQWSFVIYGGATHTAAADVSISLPAFETNLTLEQVPSTSDSWSSPIYYGWRVGRAFGERRRIAMEAEFMHAKVFFDTSRIVGSHGSVRGEQVNGSLAMSALVQRLGVSHGLNFLLGNVALGDDIGGTVTRPRVRIEGRAGAGITLPHVEATVLGLSRDEYQYGGPGGQLAAGVLVRVAGPLFALGEYKLTIARESLSLEGGDLRATFVSHHGVAGASWRF